MKHPILAAYLSKKLTAKDALTQIGAELAKKNVSKKDQALLLAASDAILDNEVPLEERNADAEEAFSARLNQGE